MAVRAFGIGARPSFGDFHCHAKPIDDQRLRQSLFALFPQCFEFDAQAMLWPERVVTPAVQIATPRRWRPWPMTSSGVFATCVAPVRGGHEARGM